MTSDTAKPDPPSGTPQAAPPVPETAPAAESKPLPLIDPEERRQPASDSPRLLALFSIDLVVSILVHAALVGAGLVHLSPWPAPSEEALPVTVVQDEQPPEKPKETPPPDKPKETPPPEKLKEIPQLDLPKPTPPDTSALAPETKPPPPPPPPAQAQAAPKPMPPQTPPQGTAKPASAEPPAAPPPNAMPNPPPSGSTDGAVAAVNDDKHAQDIAVTLRQQVERCWTIPPGWTSPHQVTVVLDVRLGRDGTVSGHPVLLEFSPSALGMAAAKSALAAVAQCAPYKLPPDKYGQWHETQIRLTPG